MSDLIFHPEAEAEYAYAYAWYFSRSKKAAARFITEVERVLDDVASAPESWPALDDEHRLQTLRRFPYSVVYQLQNGKPYIIAVAHSSRAPGYWKDGRRLDE